MGCPFCPLQKKTPWWIEDVVNDIVACEDLHPRGYRYRILVVGSGSSWHRNWSRYSEAERELLIGIAKAVARFHIREGRAKKLVGIDTEHFSVPQHGHVQACMR